MEIALHVGVIGGRHSVAHGEGHLDCDAIGKRAAKGDVCAIALRFPAGGGLRLRVLLGLLGDLRLKEV